MKLRRAVFIATLAAIPSLFAAEAGIEFSGILTADGKTRLALTDTASKTTTWVEAGGVFNGYTVARFDAKEEAVFLKKNGQEIRLGLVPEKTSEAATSPAPSPGPASVAAATTPTANAVRTNLQRLALAARRVQAERGVTTVSFADLVGPGKPIPELSPVAGENYSTLLFGPNTPAISVTTTDGTTVSVDLPPAPTAAQPAATAAQTLPAPTAPLTPAPNASTAAASATATPTPPTDLTALPAPTATPAPPAPNATATTSLPPAPEAPAPTGRESSAAPSYTIQGGDTLESIAHLNGVTVQQLHNLNPALSGSSLRAGQTIRIR